MFPRGATTKIGFGYNHFCLLHAVALRIEWLTVKQQVFQRLVVRIGPGEFMYWY